MLTDVQLVMYDDRFGSTLRSRFFMTCPLRQQPPASVKFQQGFRECFRRFRGAIWGDLQDARFVEVHHQRDVIWPCQELFSRPPAKCVRGHLVSFTCTPTFATGDVGPNAVQLDLQSLLGQGNSTFATSQLASKPNNNRYCEWNSFMPQNTAVFLAKKPESYQHPAKFDPICFVETVFEVARSGAFNHASGTSICG